jgi:hypothetical protein
MNIQFESHEKAWDYCVEMRKKGHKKVRLYYGVQYDK